MSGRRRGFTLVELLASLAIASATMLAVASMTSVANASAAQLAAIADSAISSSASVRQLEALLRRAERRENTNNVFEGTASRVAFDSWCERVGGWLERCHVELTLLSDSTAVGRLEITSDRRGHLNAMDTDSGARFLFRGPNVLRDGWFSGWGGGVVLPVALGIVERADTLVLAIGAHR
jgi:prepilin-type N-terminal cleavage/methylation domain-containing protein